MVSICSFSRMILSKKSALFCTSCCCVRCKWHGGGSRQILVNCRLNRNCLPCRAANYLLSQCLVIVVSCDAARTAHEGLHARSGQKDSRNPRSGPSIVYLGEDFILWRQWLSELRGFSMVLKSHSLDRSQAPSKRALVCTSPRPTSGSRQAFISPAPSSVRSASAG